MDDDQDRRGILLLTTDIHQIYRDFQAASHSDQKFNILEFNGEHNNDIFMNMILQVEAVFVYQQFRDPKPVQLTKTKLCKGAMHWWRNL